MAVDTAQYVGLIDESVPESDEFVAEGDDQIRATKKAIRQSFPNVTGAVLATHTELNYVDGVTSPIQTQLDAKAPLASPALTGNPTAPTQGPTDNSTKLATTAFVTAKAFAAALPAMSAATRDQVITNDGSTARWAPSPFMADSFFYASI